MNSNDKLNKKEKITNSIILKLLAEKEMHQQLIDMFEKESAFLPEESLSRKVINGKVYLYQIRKDEKGLVTQKYLSRNENEFASAIKRQHFLQKSLKRLHNNIKAMNAFLNKYNPYDASDIVADLPKAYESLPEKYFRDIHKNILEPSWQNKPYNKNESYPDGLVNCTSCGIKVRSKSEAIIASMLENKNIPFRYEAELKINEHAYYPDFTILKPRDGEIIYWEHFGMTNNAEYSLSMEQKLIAYTRHGVIPWDNLVTTFDSKNGSIDAQIIQNIIKAFIL